MPWMMRLTLAFVLGWVLAAPYGLQPALAQSFEEEDEEDVGYEDKEAAGYEDEEDEEEPIVIRGSVRTSKSAKGDIPLVILHNDPSRKFVRVTLKGKRRSRETLLLVDTGAQITLIDEALAKELKVEHIKGAVILSVTGFGKGWVARLPALRLGGTEVKNLPVMVGPMPGLRLLGMDVLERLQLSVGPRNLQRGK